MSKSAGRKTAPYTTGGLLVIQVHPLAKSKGD